MRLPQTWTDEFWEGVGLSNQTFTSNLSPDGVGVISGIAVGGGTDVHVSLAGAVGGGVGAGDAVGDTLGEHEARTRQKIKKNGKHFIRSL
jgi:outer membrane lipoprotein SlyB